MGLGAVGFGGHRCLAVEGYLHRKAVYGGTAPSPRGEAARARAPKIAFWSQGSLVVCAAGEIHKVQPEKAFYFSCLT